MRRIERENTGDARPGQDLVVLGYAGLSGTIEIVKYKKDELCQWFSKDYVNRIPELEQFLIKENQEQWKKRGAAEWEPAGEGGILKALWDLSGAYMNGICFSLEDIPVRQETIEVCERYDLNPYRLFSSGCLLFTADNGGNVVSSFKKQGLPAAVIGKVTGGIKRVIDHGETVGYLDRPADDEMYKILSHTVHVTR